MYLYYTDTSVTHPHYTEAYLGHSQTPMTRLLCKKSLNKEIVVRRGVMRRLLEKVAFMKHRARHKKLMWRGKKKS